MSVRIGTSGWSYDHWVGILYPKSASSLVRLDAYVTADGQPVILWDYRGPAQRIPAAPSLFMANLWHTATWAPECCPGALDAPAATRRLDIDWMRYAPA